MGEQPHANRCRKCHKKHHYGEWRPERMKHHPDGGWWGFSLEVIGPFGYRPSGRYKRTVKVRCLHCGHEWFTSDRGNVRDYAEMLYAKQLEKQVAELTPEERTKAFVELLVRGGRGRG